MTDGEKVRIGIAGQGGREAAIIDQLLQDPDVEGCSVFPGNALMQANAQNAVITHPGVRPTDVSEIVDAAQQEGVGLFLVTQDNAVEAGLTNALQAAHITCPSPTCAAGEIEWSKAFARSLLEEVGLNALQPAYHVFTSAAAGKAFLREHPDQGWAVKADNLCEGKGVIIATTNIEAARAIDDLTNKFKKAAGTYLLEELLRGSEFSAFALCDGKNYQTLGYARDYKRAQDGDVGPNTGGMGAVSHPKVVTEAIQEQVQAVFAATLRGLHQMGRPYVGVLYAGCMVVDGQLKILEFNARPGDPETQVLIPGIKNLLALFRAAANRNIATTAVQTDGMHRVVVAATAARYPEDYSAAKGQVIYGLEEARAIPGIRIYGAGTALNAQEQLVVDGGRVLYVAGEGGTTQDARQIVYQALRHIYFGNRDNTALRYRTDIGLDE